eukprot:COSAG06_NODE_28879_length_566_cov_0.987152_1_plen_166_part_01
MIPTPVCPEPTPAAHVQLPRRRRPKPDTQRCTLSTPRDGRGATRAGPKKPAVTRTGACYKRLLRITSVCCVLQASAAYSPLTRRVRIATTHVSNSESQAIFGQFLNLTVMIMTWSAWPCNCSSAPPWQGWDNVISGSGNHRTLLVTKTWLPDALLRGCPSPRARSA